MALMNPQAIAATYIHKVVFQHYSLSDVLDGQKNAKNAGLIQELSYGTIRWFSQLHSLANQLLHSPLPPKHQDILCLFAVGLYQLMHTRIPVYAAISETVNGAKHLQKAWATGLLNKTLRLFLQRREILMSSCMNDPAIFYSHPEWLIEILERAWPEHWQNICSANNHKPPLFIRVNAQKKSRTEYLKTLIENKIEASEIPEVAQALQITHPISAEKLPGFLRGDCSIQDLAGQRVVELLDLKSDIRVLDACAAPGSKTCHILELEPKLTKLIAIDIDPQRLNRIQQNIARLGLSESNVELISANAVEPKSWWDGILFDRILIDAPCSGTGVIRRHPDIKMLRVAEDIPQYTEQQLLLLKNLWPLLAVNGKLVYTTCSVIPEENDQVIQQFISTLVDEYRLELNQQLLPEDNGPDGFYYAVIRKLK